MLSDVLPKSIELWQQMPSGYEHPKYLLGALAVGVAGVGAEAFRTFRGRSVQAKGTPLADPFEGERAARGLNRSNRMARASFLTGIALTGCMVAQGSKPYVGSEQAKGSATVVIDGTNAANAPIGHGSDTRLVASVDASLHAAESNNVPFTFIVTGSEAKIVDNQPATHKKLDTTVQKIQATLTPTFSNSESHLAAGITNAASLDGPNNIIVLASDIDKANRDAVRQNLPDAAKKNVYAVVVGSGNANYSVIPGETITATTNAHDFKAVLDPSHVYQATSTKQAEKYVDQIVDRTSVTHNRKNSKFFEDLLITFGLAGAVIATRNRLGGMFKRRRG